jgi:hypothetical protein
MSLSNSRQENTSDRHGSCAFRYNVIDDARAVDPYKVHASGPGLASNTTLYTFRDTYRFTVASDILEDGFGGQGRPVNGEGIIILLLKQFWYPEDAVPHCPFHIVQDRRSKYSS